MRRYCMEWTKDEPTTGGVYWYAGEASHSCSCKGTKVKIAKVKADENGNLVVLFDVFCQGSAKMTS